MDDQQGCLDSTIMWHLTRTNEKEKEKEKKRARVVGQCGRKSPKVSKEDVRVNYLLFDEVRETTAKKKVGDLFVFKKRSKNGPYEEEEEEESWTLKGPRRRFLKNIPICASYYSISYLNRINFF